MGGRQPNQDNKQADGRGKTATPQTAPPEKTGGKPEKDSKRETERPN
jgi:hypothetical protein